MNAGSYYGKEGSNKVRREHAVRKNTPGGGGGITSCQKPKTPSGTRKFYADPGGCSFSFRYRSFKWEKGN